MRPLPQPYLALSAADCYVKIPSRIYYTRVVLLTLRAETEFIGADRYNSYIKLDK